MKYKGIIYKLTSPSKKCYIGQTINLKKRMSEYKTFHHCENQKKFFKALKKYGFENFTLEILEEISVDTQSELKEKLNCLEVYFIEKYNSTVIGYNICKGGNQHRLGVKET
jgi:group I intron endonuclease